MNAADSPVPGRDQRDDMGASGKTGSFPTTQWSMVINSVANSDTQAHAALETLCGRYWFPLYAFVRRQGRAHHEAEDSTQEFLAQLLSAGGLGRARPERGRFRTFLLSGMRNFLTSEWRRSTAAKRGGGAPTIQIGSANPDERYCLEPADTGLTPEQAFDRSWALGMIDHAIDELREEYASTGRGKLFDTLARQIWADRDTAPDALSKQATEVGMTTQAYTVALHRARRRLGDRLRASVAETVADPGEIDAELRHLVSAINGTRAGA